jgi:hypothetical protein
MSGVIGCRRRDGSSQQFESYVIQVLAQLLRIQLSDSPRPARTLLSAWKWKLPSLIRRDSMLLNIVEGKVLRPGLWSAESAEVSLFYVLGGCAIISG